MHTLLVKKIPRRLNADIMLDVFQPKLFPEGSNIRHLEDAAMVFWANFLQIVESKNSFLYYYVSFILVSTPVSYNTPPTVPPRHALTINL